MATKEVKYRKWQGHGIPNIAHVKKILCNQMIKEKVLILSTVEESNFWCMLVDRTGLMPKGSLCG